MTFTSQVNVVFSFLDFLQLVGLCFLYGLSFVYCLLLHWNTLGWQDNNPDLATCECIGRCIVSHERMKPIESQCVQHQLPFCIAGLHIASVYSVKWLLVNYVLWELIWNICLIINYAFWLVCWKNVFPVFFGIVWSLGTTLTCCVTPTRSS